MKTLTVLDYKKALTLFINKNEDSLENVIPTILSNWDHSPRSGKQGVILNNSTPELFEKNIQDAIDCIKDKQTEKKIIFLKSWNEWGEGNYVEPDLIIGHGYLKILKKNILS